MGVVRDVATVHGGLDRRGLRCIHWGCELAVLGLLLLVHGVRRGGGRHRVRRAQVRGWRSDVQRFARVPILALELRVGGRRVEPVW